MAFSSFFSPKQKTETKQKNEPKPIGVTAIKLKITPADDRVRLQNTGLMQIVRVSPVTDMCNKGLVADPADLVISPDSMARNQMEYKQGFIEVEVDPILNSERVFMFHLLDQVFDDDASVTKYIHAVIPQKEVVNPLLTQSATGCISFTKLLDGKTHTVALLKLMNTSVQEIMDHHEQRGYLPPNTVYVDTLEVSVLNVDQLREVDTALQASLAKRKSLKQREIIQRLQDNSDRFLVDHSIEQMQLMCNTNKVYQANEKDFELYALLAETFYHSINQEMSSRCLGIEFGGSLRACGLSYLPKSIFYRAAFSFGTFPELHTVLLQWLRIAKHRMGVTLDKNLMDHSLVRKNPNILASVINEMCHVVLGCLTYHKDVFRAGKCVDDDNYASILSFGKWMRMASYDCEDSTHFVLVVVGWLIRLSKENGTHADLVALGNFADCFNWKAADVALDLSGNCDDDDDDEETPSNESKRVRDSDRTDLHWENKSVCDYNCRNVTKFSGKYDLHACVIALLKESETKMLEAHFISYDNVMVNKQECTRFDLLKAQCDMVAVVNDHAHVVSDGKAAFTPRDFMNQYHLDSDCEVPITEYMLFETTNYFDVITSQQASEPTPVCYQQIPVEACSDFFRWKTGRYPDQAQISDYVVFNFYPVFDATACESYSTDEALAVTQQVVFSKTHTAEYQCSNKEFCFVKEVSFGCPLAVFLDHLVQRPMGNGSTTHEVSMYITDMPAVLRKTQREEYEALLARLPLSIRVTPAPVDIEEMPPSKHVQTLGRYINTPGSSELIFCGQHEFYTKQGREQIDRYVKSFVNKHEGGELTQTEYSVTANMTCYEWYIKAEEKQHRKY
jgi:hypothetical protein